MKNKILTPNQVAEMMMVSPATVRQWAANGKLEALATPGGHRRFRMTDIISFAEKKGLVLNTEEESKKSVSILIVDDDIQFANFLKEFIKNFDDKIMVKIAEDGFEAGRLVHTFFPDLILMDLMMPTMDGFETCKSIKSDPKTEQIRVIAMTGFGSDENQNRIKALGAEDCLLKPINEEILENYIKTLVV